jgi:hypothetical protein
VVYVSTLLGLDVFFGTRVGSEEGRWMVDLVRVCGSGLCGGSEHLVSLGLAWLAVQSCLISNFRVCGYTSICRGIIRTISSEKGVKQVSLGTHVLSLYLTKNACIRRHPQSDL